jgi:hypothetical protein
MDHMESMSKAFVHGAAMFSLISRGIHLTKAGRTKRINEKSLLAKKLLIYDELTLTAHC